MATSLRCSDAAGGGSISHPSLLPRDPLLRRWGFAVFIYFIVLLYMFVAVAIVCDEYLVPALAVAARRLNLNDDLAGATFMAGGGSAPELFISIIGVFVTGDNENIGTIVGNRC